MKNKIINALFPHITAIIVFLLVSAIYFYPQLQGDVLHQHDKLQSQGMSKEISDFRAATGEEALWTNSAFAGMPAYQISVESKNFVKAIKDLVLKLIPRPIGYMFFLMIGFYILLLCFNVNPWLAIVGGIAFGLSSLNLLYLGGGHNSKIHAISFIPPIIGGIYYAYRKNLLVGSAILGLFVTLHISANHLQMTYYILYLIGAIFIVELYLHYKQKQLPKFIKTSAILLLVGFLAILPNITNILTTYEYSKYTTRGKSELTISADKQTVDKVDQAALDRGYIKQYSLGFGEVWSLVIPNVKGGKMNLLGNNKDAMENVSAAYKNTIAQQPSYWGEQMATGGAFYFGAGIFLLFVLGMFFVKEKLKWAFIIVSALAIMLSWKYGALTDWFIDNVPLFNKFRDTKMMLIIAQLSFPFIGFLFLKELFKDEINKKKFIYVSAGTIGLLGLFYLMPGLWFSFFSNAEINQFDKLLHTYKTNPQAIQQITDMQWELENVRKSIFKSDCLRSIFFISAIGLLIYLFIIKKVKKNTFIVVLGLLILIDLWAVDKRYLNDSNFEDKPRKGIPFQMTQADQYILQDKDPNFKVLNLTVSPFNDGSTSYYHKSLGGYHGAKLKRYQELIEFHISKNNMDVLNMLNTKYFIVPDKNRQPIAQYNPNALGNAWFVENYRIVPTANAEILALNDFNPADEVIIDQRFGSFVEGKEFTRDTISNIVLTEYKPNYLSYNAKCTSNQLVVFSEIYYPKGWNAFVDGKPADYFRVNYVLRAMVIPEGEHTVEFKFKPRSYYVGNKITMASSFVLILFLIFALGREIRIYFKENKE